LKLLALDTDVVVSWVHAGARRHRETRRLLERELSGGDCRLGLTASVVLEFLHVITDERRFEAPLSMAEATEVAAELWSSPDVDRIPTPPRVVPRTLELLRRHRLGRKRIHDTALAATLEAAGIRRLATWNPGDFAVFDFLEVLGGDRT
jgi:predicted nucleic acid-binding protein